MGAPRCDVLLGEDCATLVGAEVMGSRYHRSRIDATHGQYKRDVVRVHRHVTRARRAIDDGQRTIGPEPRDLDTRRYDVMPMRAAPTSVQRALMFVMGDVTSNEAKLSTCERELAPLRGKVARRGQRVTRFTGGPASSIMSLFGRCRSMRRRLRDVGATIRGMGAASLKVHWERRDVGGERPAKRCVFFAVLPPMSPPIVNRWRLNSRIATSPRRARRRDARMTRCAHHAAQSDKYNE